MKIIKALTRQELYDMVWSKSLTTIAKEYEVSYSILMKIYKDNSIPCPDSGYWSKLKFNKEVVKKPLPEIDDTDEISFNEIAKKEVIEIKPLSKRQQLKGEIGNKLEKYLKVPEKLVKPHALIVEAKKDLKNKEPSVVNNIVGFICSSSTEEMINWFECANQKADWYDPLIEKENEFLFNVDKENWNFKKVNGGEF